MQTGRIAAVVGACWLGCAEVQAQILFWDTDTVTPGAQGGAGNWVATPFWFDGVQNVQWSDGLLASFGGTAGNVSLNSTVAVGGLTFTTGGYTISGASTLTLAAPGIDVTVAGQVAFISVPIGGSAGLVKNGPG